MENEPPEHTRLRRLVAGAFNRGHVERLRPRVRELAASLLAQVDPAEFDVVGEYAEPLPVLVIAELLGRARVGRARPAALVAGDRADVRAGALGPRSSTRRCGRPRSSPAWSASSPPSAGEAAARRPGLRPRRGARRRRPALARTRSSPPRCCCSTPATRRRSTCSATAWSRCSARPPPGPGPGGRPAWRRCSASTPRCSSSSAPRPRRSRSAGVRRRAGPEDRGAARRRQPRPGGLRRRRHLPPRPRPQPAPRLRRRAALLPRRAAGAHGAGRVARPPARHDAATLRLARRAAEPGHVRAAWLPRRCT